MFSSSYSNLQLISNWILATGILSILYVFLSERIRKNNQKKPSSVKEKDILDYFSDGVSRGYPETLNGKKLLPRIFDKITSDLVKRGLLHESIHSMEVPGEEVRYMARYGITEEGRKYLSNLSQTDLA
jgi:hypothetical protein